MYRVVQIDVINEALHGHWYEETIGDPLFEDKVYNETHRLDPDAHLFINDYKGLRLGVYTSVCLHQWLCSNDPTSVNVHH